MQPNPFKPTFGASPLLLAGRDELIEEFSSALQDGLPCIGSRAGGIPEMMADGQTGFIVDADDVDALSTALSTLADNPARAREMGAAGRERVLESFTWARVTRRMLERIAAAHAVRA